MIIASIQVQHLSGHMVAAILEIPVAQDDMTAAVRVFERRQ
jgi:hypothetical protein